MQVKEYMKTEVVTIPQDKTLGDAVKKMVEEKSNSLVVVESEGSKNPVGLFNSLSLIKQVLPEYLEDDPSVSDFAGEGQLICFSVKAKDKPLKDVMFNLEGKFKIVLKDEDPMVKAASYASKKSIRTLPVVNADGDLVGVIDRTGIKNAIYDSLFKENHENCEASGCQAKEEEEPTDEPQCGCC